VIENTPTSFIEFVCKPTQMKSGQDKIKVKVHQNSCLLERLANSQDDAFAVQLVFEEEKSAWGVVNLLRRPLKLPFERQLGQQLEDEVTQTDNKPIPIDVVSQQGRPFDPADLRQMISELQDNIPASKRTAEIMRSLNMPEEAQKLEETLDGLIQKVEFYQRLLNRFEDLSNSMQSVLVIFYQHRSLCFMFA